jgi:hypothetical protein
VLDDISHSSLVNRRRPAQAADAKWFKGRASKLIPSHVHNIEC